MQKIRTTEIRNSERQALVKLAGHRKMEKTEGINLILLAKPGAGKSLFTSIVFQKLAEKEKPCK